MSVVIETTLGDVTVDLFIEERPQTCLNFLKLCKIKYYNLCLFHSVSSNFLAQTGDPTGKGDGGESIFGLLKGAQHRLYLGEKMPKIKHDRTGLLSMVSHGDGMLGSQFVITLSGNLTSLDPEHCVFGHVVEGVDLLLKLNEAITDDQHRPYQDIRITHTVILEDPFPDPEGLLVPPESPLPPSTKDVAYSRIPADEPLGENYSQQELDEMVQQREAAARAAILEMVGDIPDADIAPPENVLFVCKLNPVTSDHDLSIIFSRFGTVKSCEVIRDQVTGDSLQYAFIEFEDRKACEDAYFKMDNVLIDDRRIHVDFSQSVAKLKWKGKGRGIEYLGPPPPGGWGNTARRNNTRGPQDAPPHTNNYKKTAYTETFNNAHRTSFRNARVFKGEKEERLDRRRRKRNDDDDDQRKVVKKKEKAKRKKSSSSSSSDSVTDSSDSSSYSSSGSSEAKPKKRKRSSKVLVVVKTPSSRNRKTKKSSKSKSKREMNSETDSETDDSDSVRKRKSKKRKKVTTDSSESSSEERIKKKKKRKTAAATSSSEDEPSRTRKKRKRISETSESSTDYEHKHSSSSRRKKVRNRRKRTSYSSSDSDRNKSNRIKRIKSKEKRKKHSRKNKKWR